MSRSRSRHPRRMLVCLALLAAASLPGAPATAQSAGRPPRAPRPSVRPASTGPSDARQHAPDTSAQASGLDLDAFITGVMADKHIPGLSAAIVKDGQLFWSGAFGLADPGNSTPVTNDTLFMLASVSKTITGTALMQLFDQQLFALDDPINDALPFAVVNPDHPADVITYRMLLTHTSSLKDNWGAMPYYPGDSPYPLGDYLADYLVPGGALYDPLKNYASWAPGTDFAYANNGLALVGYLVEKLSGLPFDQACESALFAPLGMTRTAWFLADLDPNQIAMPCHWNGSGYVPYGQYGYSDYPSGQLRTTAIELSRFLSMFIQDGQLDGTTILQPGTAQAMRTPQIPAIDPTQGLVWYQWQVGGRDVWGHGGGDQGVTTEMWFDPDTRIGVVALTNGESYLPQIVDALFDKAEELPPATSLTAEAPVLSAAPGQSLDLTFAGGTLNTGRDYVILGSVSGTSPGTPLPGGSLVLPLNWDPVTELIVENLNSSMFTGFYGTLGLKGMGRASFHTLGGLPGAAIGLELSFAAALLSPWDFVSNPLTIQITP